MTPSQRRARSRNWWILVVRGSLAQFEKMIIAMLRAGFNKDELTPLAIRVNAAIYHLRELLFVLDSMVKRKEKETKRNGKLQGKTTTRTSTSSGSTKKA